MVQDNTSEKDTANNGATKKGATEKGTQCPANTAQAKATAGSPAPAPSYRSARGIVLLPRPGVEELAKYLHEKQILAALRSYADSPAVISLIVAVDEQDRVALLGTDIDTATLEDAKADEVKADGAKTDSAQADIAETGGAEADGEKAVALLGQLLTPGQPLPDLVKDLAEHFEAEVRFGSHQASALPPQTPQVQKPARIKPLRALELTKLDSSSVPLFANSLEVKLWVGQQEAGDSVILFEDTEKLSQWKSYVGGEHSLIELTWGRTDGSEQQTLSEGRLQLCLDKDEDQWQSFSWDKENRFVWGGRGQSVSGPQVPDFTGEAGLPEAAIRALTDLVGATALAGQIMAHYPQADYEQLRQALTRRGEEGLSQFATALGLGKQYLEFLLYHRPAEQVESVHSFEPRGWYNALGRSLEMMLEDEAQTPDTLWGFYHNLATRRPELVQALVLVETGSALGALACSLPWHRSGRRWRPWLTALGVMLLFDSLAELSLVSHLRTRSGRKNAQRKNVRQ